MGISSPIEELRYLALGDSYTYAEGIAPADRFCMQLAALCNAAAIPMLTPQVIARTGWTTADLWKAIAPLLSTEESGLDLITVLIGVNNQYQGRSLAEYEVECARILEAALKLVSGKPTHVFALSIPDYSVTPFCQGRDRQKISGEIDAFNRVYERLVREHGLFWLNITPATRQVSQDPSLLAPDGLHYSRKMYGIWATALWERIEGAFKKTKGKN